MRRLEVHRPGRVDYREAWQRQRELVRRRVAGEIPDTLVLLEHPPTVTLSKRCTARDLRVSPEELARGGIAVCDTNRGGLATLHNPGQLVGYLVFNLEDHGRDLHGFLRRIEGLLVDTAARYGVSARCIAGKTGVFVGERKLASIGIAVHRWVSWHGFALNVCNDLAAFDAIVPCGLVGVEMTSLSRELGRPVGLDEAAEQVVGLARARFGFDRVEEPARKETGVR